VVRDREGGQSVVVIIALIDNGSIEAAAHLNLRVVAAALGSRVAQPVVAVSWRHSDRIPAALLGGHAAQTLRPWLQSALAGGERTFLFVPFFVSAQGAIGSSLLTELEALKHQFGAFNFSFTEGLAARDAIVPIVTTRVRECIRAQGLRTPSVIVVDHGGPSPASAALRNDLADRIRVELGTEIGPLAAASMEGAEHPHNRPLLAEQLARPGFNAGDVVIAPLFLSPGRHAGAEGDLAQIAIASEAKAAAPLRCHFTELIGTHPHAIEVLFSAVRENLDRR